ncbi:putative Histone-fold protein [Trachipleistophora hominis]|uniref:Putative Histone-fold protein n=1 Tax=Trachipleistophora hominis TaxID=72359 RepID=L7JSE6_TRAHO|nr:putative Histone-fold protein [Trachipleistophora hominis]
MQKDNEISPESIKILLKKLAKKRRISGDTVHLLAELAFYTAAFLATASKSFSEEDKSEFIRNGDIKRVFEVLGIEGVYDETYDEFIKKLEYIK